MKCSICGTPEGGRSELSRLRRVGEDEGAAVTICQDCLELRHEHTWGLDTAEGKKLLEELERHDHPNLHRYAYLVEADESVHLVRLRDDWLEAKAASLAGGSPAAPSRGR